jgi:hypothetical protein
MGSNCWIMDNDCKVYSYARLLHPQTGHIFMVQRGPPDGLDLGSESYGRYPARLKPAALGLLTGICVPGLGRLSHSDT